MALPTFTGTGKAGAAAGSDVCCPDPPAVPLVGFAVGAALPDGFAGAGAEVEADGDLGAGAEVEGDVEGDAESEVEGEAGTEAEAVAEADGLADAELLWASWSPRSAPGATEAAEPAGSFWPPQADTRVIAPMTARTDAYLQEERSTK
ncbi:hypothetical protein [Streptomyces hydrogenans]